MFHDRFIKLMLIAIVVLLAANLVRTRTGDNGASINLIAPAQAQNLGNTSNTPIRYTMRRVDGLQVEDLKDVVSLGDGKSFVVSNAKGFMVFTVETSR